MSEKNYLTREAGGLIRLHGFDIIKDFAYISVLPEKQMVVLESEELNETDNRFRVIVTKERTITNLRFFHLVKDYHLLKKRFFLNAPLGNYFPTNLTL